MISSEEKLEQLLFTPPANVDRAAFRQWLLQKFDTATSTAQRLTLEDFAVYMLNVLRQRTELHLRISEGDISRQQTPVRSIKPQTQRHSQPGTKSPAKTRDLSISPSPPKTDESLTQSQLDDLSQSLYSMSLQGDSSTPVRRSISQRRTDAQCSTPNSSHDWSNRSGTAMSSGGNGGSSSASGRCLGDFIVLGATPTNRSQRHKKAATPTTPVAVTPSHGQRKKRVVPTTISRRSVASEPDASPFGTGSSFGHENNILRIANTEVEDRSKCTILEARKTLKQNADEISKELQVTTEAATVTVESNDAAPPAPEVTTEDESSTVDLTTVTQRDVIDTLAGIYSALIDLNLVTNVLTEIAFCLNLLHAVVPSSVGARSENNTSLGLKLLDSAVNCVYFAMRVLQRQSATLILLDVKTLSVLLQSDRLDQLAPELHAQLVTVHVQKQRIEAAQKLHDTASVTAATGVGGTDKSFQNVHFQAEHDSREHFTSNNEFVAFKTQRDLFYKGLKLWMAHHLNPLQNCAARLQPLVIDIFRLSENPVNMAHFAKLFVAQLLISASDATSPEEIGLETAAVDQLKLSRLTQRLVAPSTFSVDYQFPRYQAFFRDFIVLARSLAFAEQLKVALYSQLMLLNDSTFEQLNLRRHNSKDGNDDTDDKDECADASSSRLELVVRPEVLASMLLLAKFLGFVTALPFSSDTIDSGLLKGRIEKKQVWLRSHFQPHFDVCHLLDDAIRAGKLLITLPWLVQYMAMLDGVTLHMQHFVLVLQRLFALYAKVISSDADAPPMANFIVRCCLGWLFEEKVAVSEQYYSYRRSNVALTPPATTTSEEVAGVDAMSPLLEALLTVACPFLAEFRVAIMPTRYAQSKHVSRTGRYRYITLSSVSAPNMAAGNGNTEEPCAIAVSTEESLNQQQQAQAKLIEAFLHAQNSSMRRLIDFITERTYKSVVKDGQLQILLPSKTAADSLVNKITSCHQLEVATAVDSIYKRAANEALQQWEARMPQLIAERSGSALNALLPADTTPVIKHTYQRLICRNAMYKVQQWTNANMVRSQDFYCSNLEEMAQKICKSNAKECCDVAHSSDLLLVKATPSVSNIIDDIQYWLHCTSLRPELCSALPTPLHDLLRRVLLAGEANTLPTVFYRLICGALIQLLQQMIARMPQLVDDELLQLTCCVFVAPTMLQSNRMCKKQRMEEHGDSNAPKADNSPPNPYKALINVPFIKMLGARCECYNKLGALLIALISENVVSVDFVNTLFVAIFKEDWEFQTLNKISLMLRHVASATATVRPHNLLSNDENDEHDRDNNDDDDGKSHLFMEVLADFSRDTDDF